MEYNRLIAYIYSYNNGMKTKNTGFAKIEVRGGNLKLHISMKCAYTDGPSDWRVYYFVRENGLECGIGLGVITLKNGVGEFNSIEAADNICGSSRSFKDIAGMYISRGEDSEKIFASEWDDQGFSVDRITYVIGEKPLILPKEPDMQNKLENTQEVMESEQPQLEPVIQEITEAEYEPDKDNCRWWETFDDREKYHLFADDDIYDCVEITPDDIVKMPDTNWALKNNSFVNHGYFNFRHLILGRTYAPSGCNYIIGVPGIYTRRDRSTAAMYGFNHFKFSMRSDIRLSQFGYWYRELDN